MIIRTPFCSRFNRPVRSPRTGFSLIEMLSVIAIMGLISAIAVPVITNLSGGRGIKNQAALLAGLIEQARTNALTQGTYTYLCFYPKDNNSGFIVIALNSTQGVGDYSDSTEFNKDLRVISRPCIFDSVILSTLSDSAPGKLAKRASRDASLADLAAPSPAPMVTIPGRSGQTPIHYVVRFNPRGEMEIATATGPNTPSLWATTPVTEIGLQSVKGARQIAASVAALQVTGLTGQTQVYLP